MIPTSDERREVAERLRATKAECDERGYPWMVEDLMQALGFGTYEDGDEGIFDRLADLIDPTCQIVTDQVDDGEWGAHETYVCCSNCDNQNMFDRFTRKPHRFCPCCGARVVTGDGEEG